MFILFKIEGYVIIYLDLFFVMEGFVFIMFEVWLVVSGFEMLFCFLFFIWDIFGLYGWLGRFIVSIFDFRLFMYVMLKYKCYGYLEIFDVIILIIEEGSMIWNEKEWCKCLKEVIGVCMNVIEDGIRLYLWSDSCRSVCLSYVGGNGGFVFKIKVGFVEECGLVCLLWLFFFSGL